MNYVKIRGVRIDLSGILYMADPTFGTGVMFRSLSEPDGYVIDFNSAELLEKVLSLLDIVSLGYEKDEQIILKAKRELSEI